MKNFSVKRHNDYLQVRIFLAAKLSSHSGLFGPARHVCWRTVFFVIVCLSFCPEILAQNVQYTNEAIDRGLKSTRRVNPTTLGVEFQIPLGHYRGRGGMDVPVVLSYSSKLWGIEFQGFNPGAPPPHSTMEPFTIVTADYGKHTVRGWTSTVDMPELDFLPGERIYDQFGSPNINGNCTGGCYKVDRMMVWMPDGSGHELRASDQPRLTTQPLPNNYYAVDGSRMRYERSSGTLFLPDGSRYLMNEGYVDRNGNKLTWVGGFRDTLNRVINDPLPYGPGSGPLSPVTQTYTLPGVGGQLNYTLVWKNLEDVLTTAQPLRYIANSACPPGTGTFSPNLFASDFTGRTCIGNAGVLFNPVVLHQIILPNNQAYTFTYDIYGTIDKLTLPTGGYEKFVYGQLAPVSSPLNFKPVYAQSNRGVTQHVISPSGSGADEVQRLYSVAGSTVSMTAPDGSRTESYLWVDGGSGWGYSADSSRAGRVYDERVYSASGQMLRRKLTQWVMTGSNASTNPSGLQIANRNARIAKELEFILDTGGGPALAKTKTYSYDTTFEFDVGVEQTIVNEFDYSDVDQNTAQTLDITSVPTFPNGTLLRSTETDYLTANANYRSRNLLGLASTIRIKDGAGHVVAQTASGYDGRLLLNYDSVLNWTDPNTPFRGNITSSSRWLNFDGTTFLTFPDGPTVVSNMQYDQCGSVRKVWDARDPLLQNPTETEYSSAFDHAYPTSNTSPDPDGTGPLTALTTATEFDLSTGLVTATIDPNNQRTEFSYIDPLNRLTQVVYAVTDNSVKNQTSYTYNDSARTVTVTRDLNMFNDNLVKSVTFNDGLGRLRETRQYESASIYIAMLQEYDNLGRVLKKSNPFRQNENPKWTITAYDELNRVLSVTTPDNSVVRTAYSGNRILITDQSQHQRINRSDALGRNTEVWEITLVDQATESVSFPDHTEVTAGYLTKYSYDLLGNLTGVTQRIGTAGTTQVRTYNYDSLARLISVIDPESGTMTYRYDNNGNRTERKDSRIPVVTTTSTYDALNRVISNTYSDGTPTVTYVYGQSTVTNQKGRLLSVSSTASTYSYIEYDALGRLRSGKQTTDSQDYTISYGYDLAGNLKSETYPSGRVVQLEYDTAGRIAGVQNLATGAFYAGGLANDENNRIQYSAHGAISKMRLGNTLWEHTDFNERLQSTQIGLGTMATNSSVLQLDYVYGTTANNGNLQNQTIALPGLTLTQHYTYDALNRLETANENGGSSWKQKFLYDRYGNRSVDANANNTSPDLVGPNPAFSQLTNRIVAPAGQPDPYDGTGNLTRGFAGESYAFDAENRMTSFNGGGGQGGADYRYDGNGLRVKKVAGSVTTIFVYDVMGQLIAEYTNGATENNGTSYLTSDYLGSPRVITDANGAVKARHDYHPFGEEISLRGGRNANPQQYVVDNVRQKFTSKERDIETGLDYFGARYYASTQGRFTSPDPLMSSAKPQDPQTWNRFVFVVNNPLRYVDPEGLDTTEPWKLLTDKEQQMLRDHLNVRDGQTAEQTFNQLFEGKSFDQTVAVVTGLKMVMETVGSNAEVWSQIGTFEGGWVNGNMDVGLQFNVKNGFLDTLGRNGFEVDQPYENLNPSDHSHSAREQTETSFDPALHFVQQNNYPKERFDAHFDMRSVAFRRQTFPDPYSAFGPPMPGSGRIAEMANAAASHFQPHSIYEIRLKKREQANQK